MVETVGGATDLLRAGVGLRRPDVAGRPHLPRRAGERRWARTGIRQVDVPGVTGERVRRFLVSRDGSRFLAVLRRPRGDVVVVSRVQLRRRGRGPLPHARPSSCRGPPRSVRGSSTSPGRRPTSVAVLYPIRDLVQVRTLAVDGSPGTPQRGVADAGRRLPVAGRQPRAGRRPVRRDARSRSPTCRRRPATPCPPTSTSPPSPTRADPQPRGARLRREPGACCPDGVLPAPARPRRRPRARVDVRRLRAARPAAVPRLPVHRSTSRPVPRGRRRCRPGSRRRGRRGSTPGCCATWWSGHKERRLLALRVPLGALLAGAVAAAVGPAARPGRAGAGALAGRPRCAPAATTRRTP